MISTPLIYKKQNNLLSRSGPLTLSNDAAAANANCPFPDLIPEKGWYAISNTSVRKNFQVNVAISGQGTSNKVVNAFEYNQDRQMDKGNKFGAWFRNDLELYPGPDFRWNGAIHTEGNLMAGQGDNKIRFYLVSSPNSCIYTEDASEITMAQYQSGNTITYQGQAITFSSSDNNYSGNSLAYIFPGTGVAPSGTQEMKMDTEFCQRFYPNRKPQ